MWTGMINQAGGYFYNIAPRYDCKPINAHTHARNGYSITALPWKRVKLKCMFSEIFTSRFLYLRH